MNEGRWEPQRPFRLPMHVEEHGTDGRALLLIHGFGGNGYSWRYVIPHLTDRHRVFVVDLKGHGAAPKPPDDAYGPDDHADLIVRMIRGRDLRRVTLLGHSMGGGVALLATLQLMETEPDRVDSLVLVAGAAFPQAIPPFIGRARLPVIGPLFLELVPTRALIRRVLRSIVHDPDRITEGQVDAYSRPLRESGGKRALLEGARRILPPDIEERVARYPEIDRPTLLLWGRQDRVVPLSVGERLLETLPDARLEVVEECGHLPLEERPGPCNEAISSFLQARHESFLRERDGKDA